MDKQTFYNSLMRALAVASGKFPKHPMLTVCNASGETVLRLAPNTAGSRECVTWFITDLLSRVSLMDPDLVYAPPDPPARPSRTPHMDGLVRPSAKEILRAYCLDYNFAGLSNNEVDCGCDVETLCFCDSIAADACYPRLIKEGIAPCPTNPPQS